MYLFDFMYLLALYNAVKLNKLLYVILGTIEVAYNDIRKMSNFIVKNKIMCNLLKSKILCNNFIKF